jgi:hypothetical protein
MRPGLLTLFLAAACDAPDLTTRDGGGGHLLDGGGELPGRDGGTTDSGSPSGTDAGDSGAPETCGAAKSVCSDKAPVCVNGTCVECDEVHSSLCGAAGFCNAITHRCNDENAPFELDCDNLPSYGACTGGPREVLLVTERSGLVLMFDPSDGHYLGRFKNPVRHRKAAYWMATQGPDQCIWTTAAGDSTAASTGVQRWNTDGTLKDTVFPHDTYFDGQDDVIQAPRGIAFTRHKVYVASTQGDPAPRVVSFDLDRLAMPDVVEPFEVVLSNGSQIDSLIVLGDESLVVANRQTNRVELLPHNGLPTALLDVEASQIGYAGGGHILAGTEAEGALYAIDMNTATRRRIDPVDAVGHQSRAQGVAALDDGNWLFTDFRTVEVLKVQSTQPVGAHVTVWDDPGIGDFTRSFKQIGRACLPEAFVEERSTPDPEATSCDEPAGVALLAEDFDGSDFVGAGAQRHYNAFYELPAVGVDVTIDPSSGAEGSKASLSIYGGSTDDGGCGVKVTFDALTKPTYIGYYMRADSGVADTGTSFILNTRGHDYIAVTSLDYDDDPFGRFLTEAGVKMPVSNDWVRVQMRDIDWDSRTYDLYVDCRRVADDILFATDQADGVHSLFLTNFWPRAAAHFDQIVFK